MTAATLARREFLASTALASLAVASAGLARAVEQRGEKEPERGKRKMTIDLRCGSVGIRADQKRAAELAQRHGFESVEPLAPDLARLSDEELKDFLARLGEKGLVLSAAGLPVDFRGDDDRFRQGMERLDAFAASLERAGVTRVGTWISPSSRGLTYFQNFKRHVGRLREVAKVLEDHRLRFGLEYVGPRTSWTRGQHPFIHTLAETRDLIGEIGVKSVGLVLDSWHWYNARETVEDLRSLKNEDVVAVDLNDAPAGLPIDEQVDSRRELPAATGVIDLQGFLGALVDIGYDGPVRAEPFNRALNELDDEEAAAAVARAMRKAFALID